MRIIKNPETIKKNSESIQEQSRFQTAYERACYLLDAREYSYFALYQKLMQNYHDEELCTAVMQKLVDCNAVNDRRYAEHYAVYLVQRKGYGIQRARQEMLRKGLERNLIQEFLAQQQIFANENLSRILVKKYYRYLQDEQDYKAREKAVAGMVRLGYDFRAVRNAIEDYFAELENEENEE